MISMRRITAAVAAAVLLGALSAPAAATTTRHSFQCEETPLAQPEPGTFWIEDGIAHLRGAVYEYAVTGSPHCAGSITITVNFNLDFATAAGVLWGTGTSELDAFDGGFESTWVAHWTSPNPLASDATDIWVGRYVGHGYGELEGWQARASLLEVNHALVLEDGYAFQPGS